jgi:hypothetical protein
MSFPQWVLPFKEPHTEIKFINGRYYKYQISYHYDPARKYTVKKTGTVLLPARKNNGKRRLHSFGEKRPAPGSGGAAES